MVIVEKKFGKEKFKGADRLATDEGHLRLLSTVTTKTESPYSILWGLIKGVSRESHTSTSVVAIFARGEWVSAWVDGALVLPPAEVAE